MAAATIALLAFVAIARVAGAEEDCIQKSRGALGGIKHNKVYVLSPKVHNYEFYVSSPCMAHTNGLEAVLCDPDSGPGPFLGPPPVVTLEGNKIHVFRYSSEHSAKLTVTFYCLLPRSGSEGNCRFSGC